MLSEDKLRALEMIKDRLLYDYSKYWMEKLRGKEECVETGFLNHKKNINALMTDKEVEIEMVNKEISKIFKKGKKIEK